MTAISNLAYDAMREADHQWSRIGSTGNRVFEVGYLNPWQVSAIQKLASLGTLEPNWDSYGSAPLSDSVLDLATNLIRDVSFGDAPIPSIVPVSGGGVQIGWEKGVREAELQIHPDLSIEVLTVENGYPLDNVPSSVVSVDGLLSWLDSH
jgi:hypothetical protein